MAKTTKGKGKKKSKGQKIEPSETPKEDTLSTSKRSAKFECQSCGKVVGNAHNLKVHEHHCKFKVVEKDKKEMDREIQSAIRRLKDEFEDQRDLFQKEATDRENMLKKELDELKDILRLEIKMGHHGSAPDPPKKMEEPAEAAPVQVEPAHTETPPAQPMPIEEVITQPVVEEKVEIQASEPMPVEPPLEMVKEPVPTFSPPQAAPSPTPVQAPLTPAPVEVEVPIESPTITLEPEPIEVPPSFPEPDIVPAIAGISREMVMELLKEEMGKLVDIKPDMSNSGLSTDATERMEGLEERIQTISSELSNFTRDSRQSMENLERSIEKKLATINPKRIDRELEKVSDKVLDIMDEVGFGESLNVSKIPPNILEIVYRATLEDVVREMSRSLGEQEAEARINLALEEVRLKTSGSELFRYDGRSIVTENLAQSLQTHMISAKQIQTTYSELLRNLLDTVPYYKSKNFQAMIKIKSQEYAVDRATVLSSDVETIRNNMNNMGQMIAAFSSQLSAKAMQLEGDIKENQGSIASKSDKADMESILSGMMERAEAERLLSEKFADLRNDLDAMKDAIDNLSKGLAAPSTEKKKEPAKDGGTTAQDGGTTAQDGGTTAQAKKPKKGDKPKAPGTMVLEDEVDEEPSASLDTDPAEHEVPLAADPVEHKAPLADNKKKIMDALAADNTSKTAIQKASGLGKKEVEEILTTLVKSKLVIKKGPKNRPIYSLVIAKTEEKGGKKKEKTPSPKKKVKDGGMTAQDGGATARDDKLAKKDKTEPKIKKKDPPKKSGKDKKEPEKKSGDAKAKDIKPQDEKPDKKADKEEKKPAKPKAADKLKEKKAKPEDKPDAKPEKKKPAQDGGTTAQAKKPKKEAKPQKEVSKDEEAPPSKTMEELDEIEIKILNAIPKDGITLPNLKKKVSKDVKYTAVLRALRVLLDSGLVEAVTKGRNTLYQKIKIKKTDKTGKKEIKQEVK